MRYGLIRLDIEDFVTPESDDGLEAMLDQLDRHRLPASYGVVGEKARALAARGRQALLSRLSQKPALGFHSESHSRHPTLAEELALCDYATGVNRFLARERPGVQSVTDLIKAPVYFTQPGGNWVPEAVHALPQMGMNLYFSESWNSYLVEWTEPMWLEQVVHFSLPVPTPAPFLLGLPGNLEQAIQRLRTLAETVPEGGAFTIMTHPTELVSTKFWDAVNFGHGHTRSVLQPAPLRSRSDRESAIYALDQYFLAASEMPGIQWLDVLDLTDRIAPRSPVVVSRTQMLSALARGGIGPTRLAQGTLSAAQWVYFLAYALRHPQVEEVAVPLVASPDQFAGYPLEPVAGQPGLDLLAAADELLARLRDRAVLPDRVGNMAIAEFAQRASQQFSGRTETAPLTFLSYVKAPESLHWDWPIFPPDFRPYHLWQETRRLAWNLAPVHWKN